jgi:hypothetical protein
MVLLPLQVLRKLTRKEFGEGHELNLLYLNKRPSPRPAIRPAARRMMRVPIRPFRIAFASPISRASA